MKARLAALALALSLLLTGCSLLPKQTDAADEAILRVVTLSRGEEGLKMVAVTAGIQAKDASEPPETVEGSGEDYAAALTSMKEQRQASLTHATDWVVEENALSDLLEAFLIDPELTYAADVYLLRDQTAQEFLDAFDEETGPSRALSDLNRALGDRAVTMLELSSRLAAGEECTVPVLRAQDNKVELADEVTVSEWK